MFRRASAFTVLASLLLTGSMGAQSRVDTTQINNVVTLADSAFPVAGTASPIEVLEGKVPGVTVLRLSGAPGADVRLQLRAQLRAFEASPPLYVVDGVLLSPLFPMSLNDIEAMDVESIRILQGAEAGTAYGFRGGAGVVIINTRRGRSLPDGKLQFGARNEVGPGFSYGAPDDALAHAYRVNAAGQYVNAAGVPVSRDQRIPQTNGIKENRYVVPTYNHSDQFFQTGIFNTQSISLERNGRAINFHAGYSRNDQPGNVLNADGVQRNTVRLNGDYRWRDRLRLGLSASQAWLHEEPAVFSVQALTVFDPDVDLLAPGTGIAPYVLFPDPQQPQFVSPFYGQVSNDIETRRTRSLVNLTASFRLLSWLSVDASSGYDRGILRRTDYIPRGRVFSNGAVSTGRIQSTRDSAANTQWRGGISARKAVGKFRSTASLHADSWEESLFVSDSVGSNLSADGTPATRSIEFYSQQTTMSGADAGAGAEYDGRYFVNLLARRERPTGTGERPWKQYGRASATWRLDRESWFPFTRLNEFSVRYSAGTAGLDNRPADVAILNAQFLPDYVGEQVLAIDVGYRNRARLSLAYSSTRNRITELVNDFSHGGRFPESLEQHYRVAGKTVEATLSARVLDNPKGALWDVAVVADRRRSQVKDYLHTCFTAGLQRVCEGETLKTLWGARLVRNTNELPSVHASSLSLFDVNDEGYVVPVGAGNTWRDGKGKNLWGTAVSVDGRTYPWGLPMVRLSSEGRDVESPIGDANAALSFGVQNTVRFKALTFYAQFTGQLGGDIYNNAKQQTYSRGTHADVDQSGKADELRKPIAYYDALAASNSRYVANFVESATHARLAEASVGYTINATKFSMLRRIGAERLRVDVVGRNLFTLSGYSGNDVRGIALATGVDDFVYPQTRTFTLATGLVF